MIGSPVTNLPGASADFPQILGCFIPNFKLKYEDSENRKVDHINTVFFNLHQIKRCHSFLKHPVEKRICIMEAKIVFLPSCLLTQATSIVSNTDTKCLCSIVPLICTSLKSLHLQCNGLYSIYPQYPNYIFS